MSSDDGAATDGALASCAFDLCDGFEGSALAPVWTPNNAVAIDTTFAHSGSSSVHMHTNALTAGQNNYAVIVETATFATPPSDVWVRGWFRISQLPVGSNGMELMSTTNTLAASVGDYVFITPSVLSLYAEIPNAIANTPAQVPLDQWFCLVFHVVVSTTTSGSLTVTSDTQPGAGLNGAMTQPSPPLGEVTLGIGYGSTNVANNQPATELWVDDVIVHHDTITCAD